MSRDYDFGIPSTIVRAMSSSWRHLLLAGFVVGMQRDLMVQLRRSCGRLAEMSARLEHLSTIDSLTVISNRRQVEKVLMANVSLLERYANLGSIAFVDVDKLKDLKDTLGHIYGDGGAAACRSNDGE